MKQVAIIDKAPSRANYSEYFEFKFDQFHMSDKPIKKLLKKDVTLDFSDEPYDLVILVGSEAAKEYAKITSVTNMAGHLVNAKFVALSNPAMLVFKPEGKPDFERAVDKINRLYNDEVREVIDGDFAGINNTEDAKDFFKEVLASNVEAVAWDTETSDLYPRGGYILGLSMSYKPLHGRYILTDCLDEECIELLQAISDKYITVFHNLKFDWKFIRYHLGVDFDADRVEDTMLMHYSLDENSSHSLKALALKYTDYGAYDAELDEYKKEYCRANKILQGDFTYDLIPYETMITYAAIDSVVTLALYEKFKPIIHNNLKLKTMYRTLMVLGTIFLMNMEERGIPFDKYRLKQAEGYLMDKIQEAKEEIYTFEAVHKYEEIKGAIFNPNSVTQLRELLFDHLGLKSPGDKTDGGELSTKSEVMEKLAEQHALPASILKVRKLTKVLNTYVTKLIPALDLDGKVRTNFNMTFTTSGRLSSSGKFNAQQIPRDDPIIKGCMVAHEGYKIVQLDLKNGEVYFAAVLSRDKELQNVFKSGGDLHSTIAKSVFNLECDAGEVKGTYPGLRQASKAITFGILFGSGPSGIADTVSKETGEYYSVDRAKDDISEYFSKFSTLKGWLKQQKDTITANGFTYSHFGRKRRLVNVFSKDKGIAAHEVRSGINALIQSVSSDVNLLGAMETQDTCDRLNIDAGIFMLVHDSIVALVKDEDVTQYTEILIKAVQTDRGCSIPGCPVGVDVDVSQDYSVNKFEVYYDYSGEKLARIQAT